MRSIHRVVAVLVPVLIAACSDSSGPASAPRVDMLDDCDSASFNVVLGSGACVTNGSVTISEFNAELNATHSVAAWHFSPASLSMHVGDSILAVNRGGETHTFTEVEAFGGGIVPSLNTASNNTVVAPECQALESDDFVAAGGRYTTHPAAESGTERYQCCIHPWMRATVTVAAR